MSRSRVLWILSYVVVALFAACAVEPAPKTTSKSALNQPQVSAGGTRCSITCSLFPPGPCDTCGGDGYGGGDGGGGESSCSADCAWKEVASCECRNGEAVCGCAW